MNKVVLQLKFEGDEIKKQAMGKVSKIKGVKRIEIGEDKKMTVIGDMDPVLVDKKLKTLCSAKILQFGPAKPEATTNNGDGEKGVQQAATAPPPSPAAVLTEIPPQPSIPYNYSYPPSAPPAKFYVEYVYF